MKPKRPWLVEGRSHQWEWNGRVGKRFSTEERARRFAVHAEQELGWWDVRVLFNPVTM